MSDVRTTTGIMCRTGGGSRKLLWGTGPVTTGEVLADLSGMRWIPGGRSSNLEDRRGSGMGMPMGIGGGLITLILALIFGPGILSNGEDGNTVGTSSGEVAPADSAREEP